MSGCIDEVKARIREITTVLGRLVPNVRIGLAVYRDRADGQYAVSGIRLGSSVRQLDDFLNTVGPLGGGDGPESVDLGISYAIEKNEWREGARRVIIVFGDAPPHPGEEEKRCNSLARKWAERDGTVSTIDTSGSLHLPFSPYGASVSSAAQPMPQFKKIAEYGKGDSVLLANREQIVEHILVLAFGSEWRRDVGIAYKRVLDAMR
jgi:hypothetical protein